MFLVAPRGTDRRRSAHQRRKVAMMIELAERRLLLDVEPEGYDDHGAVGPHGA
jgi:hypothetical protein